METKIVKITEENKKEILEKAATFIKNGGLVVFPTETVYGLGANVFNEEAIKKIYLAKGRPSKNPLIVHVSEKEELTKLVSKVTDIQKKLIDAFWPGPLTIIFEKKEEISEVVTGGLSTIAIRMPSNPLSLELIRLAQVPIAAPSANESGRPSGTSGEDVFTELSGKVDMIIDEGGTDIGVESTVVKVSKNELLILRPGFITKEMLEKVVFPMKIKFATSKSDLELSPGTKYRHYAPKSRLEILEPREMITHALNLQKKGLKVGIITTDEKENLFKNFEPNIALLGNENNLQEVSKNLYHCLRFFDFHKVDIILCRNFNEEGLGVAIMDRLKRASAA